MAFSAVSHLKGALLSWGTVAQHEILMLMCVCVPAQSCGPYTPILYRTSPVHTHQSPSLNQSRVKRLSTRVYTRSGVAHNMLGCAKSTAPILSDHTHTHTHSRTTPTSAVPMCVLFYWTSLTCTCTSAPAQHCTCTHRQRAEEEERGYFYYDFWMAKKSR